MSTDDELRDEAVASIKRKRAFWNYVFVWVAVGALVIVVWWFSTPNGYFWPIWPIVGMAVAVPILGYSAYGRGAGISEKRIQDEMRRIKSKGTP
jgi:hypothetical protein